MKFCQPHWDTLRAALDQAGLGGFVAKDGQEALKKTVRSLENAAEGAEDGAAQFEPLMGAHWAIVNNAMDFVGFALMVQNEDGSDRCPLCFITADHKAKCTDPGCQIESYDHWIGHAVADQVANAKRLGLLGEA